MIVNATCPPIYTCPTYSRKKALLGTSSTYQRSNFLSVVCGFIYDMNIKGCLDSCSLSYSVLPSTLLQLLFLSEYEVSCSYQVILKSLNMRRTILIHDSLAPQTFIQIARLNSLEKTKFMLNHWFFTCRWRSFMIYSKILTRNSLYLTSFLYSYIYMCHNPDIMLDIDK